MQQQTSTLLVTATHRLQRDCFLATEALCMTVLPVIHSVSENQARSTAEVMRRSLRQ